MLIQCLTAEYYLGLIKRFFGTSEQVVHLQVLIAMIAYLLLKLVNNSLNTLQVSLQQLARLISADLFPAPLTGQ